MKKAERDRPGGSKTAFGGVFGGPESQSREPRMIRFRILALALPPCPGARIGFKWSFTRDVGLLERILLYQASDEPAGLALATPPGEVGSGRPP